MKRTKHELFTSQVVLDEVAFGDKATAHLRLETLQGVPLLLVADEMIEASRRVPTSGLLLPSGGHDATHIALLVFLVVTVLVIWFPKNLLLGKEEHSNPALEPSALRDAIEDTIAANVKPECLKNPPN